MHTYRTRYKDERYCHFGPRNLRSRAPGQGPQYTNLRGLLVSKAATWLWFGMGIGIDHAHNNNGKYARYVGVCGPQGPTFKYKGHIVSLLSNQGSHLALVWYGDR